VQTLDYWLGAYRHNGGHWTWWTGHKVDDKFLTYNDVHTMYHNDNNTGFAYHADNFTVPVGQPPVDVSQDVRTKYRPAAMCDDERDRRVAGGGMQSDNCESVVRGVCVARV
jgi:hypothetical protein